MGQQEQIPSIGRIVLYNSPGVKRPAIILSCTEGFDGVHLKIFGLNGDYVERNVTQGDTVGQWNWPPRV